jgi:hypothetical protein
MSVVRSSSRVRRFSALSNWVKVSAAALIARRCGGEGREAAYRVGLLAQPLPDELDLLGYEPIGRCPHQGNRRHRRTPQSGFRCDEPSDPLVERTLPRIGHLDERRALRMPGDRARTSSSKSS